LNFDFCMKIIVNWTKFQHHFDSISAPTLTTFQYGF
jgi:hypothetical protein